MLPPARKSHAPLQPSNSLDSDETAQLCGSVSPQLTAQHADAAAWGGRPFSLPPRADPSRTWGSHSGAWAGGCTAQAAAVAQLRAGLAGMSHDALAQVQADLRAQRLARQGQSWALPPGHSLAAAAPAPWSGCRRAAFPQHSSGGSFAMQHFAGGARVQLPPAAPTALPLAPTALPLAPTALPLAPTALPLAPTALPRPPSAQPLGGWQPAAPRVEAAAPPAPPRHPGWARRKGVRSTRASRPRAGSSLPAMLAEAPPACDAGEPGTAQAPLAAAAAGIDATTPAPQLAPQPAPPSGEEPAEVHSLSHRAGRLPLQVQAAILAELQQLSSAAKDGSDGATQQQRRSSRTRKARDWEADGFVLAPPASPPAAAPSSQAAATGEREASPASAVQPAPKRVRFDLLGEGEGTRQSSEASDSSSQECHQQPGQQQEQEQPRRRRVVRRRGARAQARKRMHTSASRKWPQRAPIS